MRKRLAVVAMLAVVSASAQAFAANPLTASVTAQIERPIAVGVSGGLSFGKIVRPKTGANTVTLTTAAARSVSGAGTGLFWLVAPASTVPTFTVSGEGAQQFTLVVASTVTLTNAGAGGGTLTVTTSNNAGCTTACALNGSLGSAGSLAFAVGGALPIANTTATGAYSGTLNVTATYN